MKFVLNRDLVVWADDGTYSVSFKKGKPVNVPSKMKTKVLSVGAEPADEDTKVAVNEVESDEESKAPVDPEERKEAINGVLETLLQENDSRNFTANNRPKIAVVRSRVGFEVDSKEINALWDMLIAPPPATEGGEAA